MKRERLQDLMLDDLYGELPPAERAAYEAGLQAHPDLRAELEANRRTLGAVRSLAEAEAPTALPETHIQAILRQARMAAAARAEAPRRTFWGRLGAFLLQPAATAAMLVLVVAGTGLYLLSYRSAQNGERFDAAERVPPRAAAESAAPAAPAAREPAPAMASTATPPETPSRSTPNKAQAATAALPAAPAVAASLDDGVAASSEPAGQPLGAKPGTIDDGRVTAPMASETGGRVARVAPDPVPVRLLGDQDFARRAPVLPSAEGSTRHAAPTEESARDRLANSLDGVAGSAAGLGRGAVGAANEATAGGAQDEFNDRERARGERRFGKGDDTSGATTRGATDAPEAAMPQLGWSDPLAGESLGEDPASAVQENRREGRMQLASPRGDLAPTAPPPGGGRGFARPAAEPAVLGSGESAPQAVAVAPAAPASPPKVAGGALAGPAPTGKGSPKAPASVAQSVAPAARPAGAAPPAAYRPFDGERTVQSRPLAGNEPLLERGLDELQAGRFNEAIVALNQALARGPAPQVAAEARLRLAEAYRKTGQAGRALAEYEAIVSRGGAPQAAVEARLEAARLLLAAGRLDQAEAQLRPIAGDPRLGQVARDLLGSIARLRAQAPAKQYGPERTLPRAGKKRSADEREVLPLDDQPPAPAEPSAPPAPAPSQPAK